MTSTQLLFHRKDPDGKQSLSQWWANIVHDDRFDRVVLFVRAELMERQIPQEQVKGAEMVLGILSTIADNPEEYNDFPSPGLHHHFEKTIKPTQPQTK